MAAPWDIRALRKRSGLSLTDEQIKKIHDNFAPLPPTALLADGVFEGGGVLGLAFLGALRCLRRDRHRLEEAGGDLRRGDHRVAGFRGSVHRRAGTVDGRPRLHAVHCEEDELADRPDRPGERYRLGDLHHLAEPPGGRAAWPVFRRAVQELDRGGSGKARHSNLQRPGSGGAGPSRGGLGHQPGPDGRPAHRSRRNAGAPQAAWKRWRSRPRSSSPWPKRSACR